MIISFYFFCIDWIWSNAAMQLLKFKDSWRWSQSVQRLRQTDCAVCTVNCTAFHLQLHNFPMHWIFSPWKKNQISTLDNLLLITPPEHWVEQIDTICPIFLHYKVTSRVTQMTLRPDTAVRCSHCRSQPQPSPHLSPSLPEWPQQQCSKCSNVTQNAIISSS